MGRSRGDGLPVELERLHRQFPELTERDLEAYAEVTARLMADPGGRARATREILERGRRARAQGAGVELLAEDSLALRYLEAIEKMQRPVRAKAGE